MNKYRLTDEKMSTDLDLAAYRIVALRDFGSVKAGDLGGFVESESNLSHDGDYETFIFMPDEDQQKD